MANDKTHIISESDALRIIDQFLRELLHINAKSIKALYLAGSLGGDYYRPGQSDIDTILILDSEHGKIWGTFDKSSELLLGITGKYKDKYRIPKGFGAVPIIEDELYPPYSESAVESDVFLFEIARLKLQGKLYYGHYPLNAVPMPTKRQLVETSLRFNHWFETEFLIERPLDVLTLTELTNCLIGNIQGLIFVDSDRLEFNKFRILDIGIKEYSKDIDSELCSSILHYLYGENSNPDNVLLAKQMEEIRKDKVKRMNAFLLSEY